MPNAQPWLVEIRLKDWIAPFQDGSRVVTYEEVVATHEINARQSGFDQFSTRVKYEPGLRRKLHDRGVSIHDCSATDAVQIAYSTSSQNTWENRTCITKHG